MQLHLYLQIFQPENIIFLSKQSRELKLCDFGLAHKIDPDITVRVAFDTLEHCAPEILNMEPVSFATDMWSLGVLAFVM